MLPLPDPRYSPEEKKRLIAVLLVGIIAGMAASYGLVLF